MTKINKTGKKEAFINLITIGKILKGRATQIVSVVDRWEAERGNRSKVELFIMKYMRILYRMIRRTFWCFADSPKCPICSARSNKYVTRNTKYRIYLCGSCNHKFVGNPWQEERIYSLYQGIDYFKKDRQHQGIFSVQDDKQWEGFIKDRWNSLVKNGILCSSPSRSVRCLEVGCCEGKLLAYLKKKGYDAIGCDVNKDICNLGKKKLGVNIINTPIEKCDFPLESFDSIFSFHTFEHLVDPVGALMRCFQFLRIGGKILLEVPSDDNELMNEDHLHFFSVNSGRLMLESVFGNCNVKENFYTNAQGKRLSSMYLSAEKLSTAIPSSQPRS